MIATVLQVGSSAALAGAAVFWIAKRKPPAGAQRFLLPYAFAASAAGLVVAYACSMEFFVRWYGGVNYEPQVQPPFGLTIEQYAIAYASMVLIPAFAMIPPVRRRAFLVALLGLAGVVPAAVGWLLPPAGQ